MIVRMVRAIEAWHCPVVGTFCHPPSGNGLQIEIQAIGPLEVGIIQCKLEHPTHVRQRPHLHAEQFFSSFLSVDRRSRAFRYRRSWQTCLPVNQRSSGLRPNGPIPATAASARPPSQPSRRRSNCFSPRRANAIAVSLSRRTRRAEPIDRPCRRRRLRTGFPVAPGNGPHRPHDWTEDRYEVP